MTGIGDEIKKARKKKGFITQKALAEYIHIDARTIGLIEMNRQVPTLKQRYVIGKALGIDLGGRLLDKKKFGERLKTLLRQKKKTQTEIANTINVSHTPVWRWVNGYSLPDDKTMETIAGILNMTLDELLEGCDDF